MAGCWDVKVAELDDRYRSRRLCAQQRSCATGSQVIERPGGATLPCAQRALALERQVKLGAL